MPNSHQVGILLGTDSRTRTYTERDLNPLPLPDWAIPALCLDPRARVELATPGLGIPGPSIGRELAPTLGFEPKTASLEGKPASIAMGNLEPLLGIAPSYPVYKTGHHLLNVSRGIGAVPGSRTPPATLATLRLDLPATAIFG